MFHSIARKQLVCLSAGLYRSLRSLSVVIFEIHGSRTLMSLNSTLADDSLLLLHSAFNFVDLPNYL